MSKKNEIERLIFKHVNRIPFGKTSTYKIIANKCGSISPRTVGKILGKNNHPIAIACHRVIQCNQKIGGYRLGIDLKRFILDWEKKIVS